MDLQNQRVIDSGCSRHITGNMSYLTDYEEIDGGYVTFGGNPKGGKITRKCTIKTGNLDFENLIDESQVLLKVPRKNNMYSVDLKNIVPKGGLTCLFAKATSDESKLWHRRLGHLNFKTMNKLVKGNLVRGLPSKLFENDQTCVACQKGKQHRASCKSKKENSASLPLHLLHMDLFGITFVKSLIKKMYCLVVTDDFSRFIWVFFLATKDETNGILKSFITGMENLVDHKVKVIRCDNGTEFKNKETNQFCEMKGSGPDWLFDINALTRTMNYEPIVASTQSNGFADTKASDNANPKSSQDDGSKPSSDDGKKVHEDSRKDSEGIDQEKEDNANSTNNVNAASINEVNVVGGKTSIELPLDPNMPELEDYNIFEDDKDVGAETDMHNLDTTIQVSPIPATRIHKDHPLDQMSSIGELTFFLGLQVKQKKDGIFINQDNYVAKILKKFGFIKVKTTSTLMETQKPLLKDEDGEEMDVHMYRLMIGSLMYLTYSRHDIMFVVSACARYQVNPKVSHLHAIKRIFSDSDYAGASLDTKSTTGAKTVNGEVHLHALVDGKKIIIIESIVRIDIQLEATEGVDCLPNATIFKQLALIGYEQVSQKLTFYKAFFSPQWKFLIHTVLQCLSPKTAELNEFSSTMASPIICLAINQMFNYSKYIFKSMVKNLDNVGKFLMYPRPKKKDTQIPQSSGPTEHAADEAVYKELDDSLVRVTTTASSLEAEQDSGGGPRCQETMGDTIAQTRFENESKFSNDPLLARGNTLQSGEDSLKLKELMELCTNLQTRVLDLEKTKTTQAEEIVSLKRSLKKLEYKKRSRTHGLKRLQAKEQEQFTTEQKATLFKEILEHIVQAKEQEQFTTEQKATLFKEILEQRRKHFAAKRAEEKRNKPPTQAQQRKIIAFKRVNTFVDFRTEVMEGSSKRAGTELEQEVTKKQKVDDVQETAEVDNDQEAAKIKELMEIVPDKKEVAIDAIPLTVKPPSIVDWKIHKEGKKTYY
ncbi:putative ribonuclease H-like domain-containing protein [Tanacetum coccineum]